MELKITSTFNLQPLERYPFEIWFIMNYKRKQDFWFTPTGKLKINASRISTYHPDGKMSDEDYNDIMSEMKKAKCDVLTNDWENKFYTTGDRSLIELPNIIQLLDKALIEYNARFAEH